MTGMTGMNQSEEQIIRSCPLKCYKQRFGAAMKPYAPKVLADLKDHAAMCGTFLVSGIGNTPRKSNGDTLFENLGVGIVSRHYLGSGKVNTNCGSHEGDTPKYQ